jgi:endonuclease YncB( thermonuclease family)
MRRSLTVAIVAGLLSGSGALGADVISGEPRIVDGDTVQIGATKIRFAGIDSPETDQVCLDAKGAKWACGVTARDELIKYSAGRSWDCDLIGTDRYGRALGKCFVKGEDVSAWLVRSGWALSFVRYSHEYHRDETAAREAKAGLWSGAFIAPWDWRHRSGATVVRGALSVPVDAQQEFSFPSPYASTQVFRKVTESPGESLKTTYTRLTKQELSELLADTKPMVLHG